jgi:hypothetical protein
VSVAAFFVSGVLCLGYVVAALFFLRFWRDTRDRLFVFFGIAFAMLAVHRVLLTLVDAPDLLGYGLRLLAFLLILAAILDKNLRA